MLKHLLLCRLGCPDTLPLAWRVFLLLLLTVSAQSLYAQDRQEEEGRREEERRRLERSEQPIQPVVEVPVSDTMYIVGPGDALSINVFGTKYYSFVATVNSDGSFVLPGLGSIYARNMTLREVRDKLYELLQREVRHADIVITLSHARQVKVTVSGKVTEPGVVTLPATARVSEALHLAGGPITDTTSMRNIIITRSNGSEVRADLLRYYRIGDLTANPFVSGGDNIYFPPIDAQIGVFGAVGNEGWFDFIPGERLYSIIEACQGISASAFLDSVEVVRFTDDDVSTERFFLNLTGYPDDQSANIELAEGDLVLIRSLSKYRKHKLVLVRGEVRYPGSYAIVPDVSLLSDLITRAGGFTADASLEESRLVRRPPENEKDQEFERLQKIPASDMREDEYEYFKARSRERMGEMVVNFKQLFLQKDRSQDVFLREGDVIEVPKFKNYIRVIGRVNNPGNVIFRKDWSFLDYVTACQGFGWRADDSDVRVVKARTGELMDAEAFDDYELEPGDTIWVPEVQEVKFWEIALTTLGVIAQIAGILGIVIAVTRN